MYRFLVFTILVVGCGYKHYHKPVKVNEEDAALLDKNCIEDLTDTINCVRPVTFEKLKSDFIGKNNKYTGVLLFEAGCVGFYSTFYKQKATIDSIENFEYTMVSIDDYSSIPFNKRQLGKLGIREDIWILDERVYGKFIDMRVKHKQFLNEAVPEGYVMRYTPLGEVVPINKELPYPYLSGCIFLVFDPHGKPVTTSYRANASEIRRVILGERPG